MIITKRSLQRRTFLRGLGTAVALPFLDAMVPSLSGMAKTAGEPAHRLGFVYAPNGIMLPDFTPKTVGALGELPPILSPLAPFRDQMVVVSGLANIQAEGGAPHTRCGSVWLCGVAPKLTEGADLQAGTTIDQFAAKQLGKATPLISLELALESNYVAGNCDSGFSCTYANTFSWRTPTTPLPMERNPRVVFERLFGDGVSGAARLAELRKDRSILDSVRGEVASLQPTLGAGDRLTMNEYLEAVRDVEARIQKTEQQGSASPLPVVGQPLGIPESYDEFAKLMFDLMFLAYQADVTRVVSFQIGRERSGQTYPWLGVPEAHHDVSHHGNNPEKMAKHAKLNQYHMTMFARLVEKMRATPDGDGSLLDHSMFLYGSGLGDGNEHSPHRLPLVLVGGGCGELKGGRHLVAPLDTPMMNLGLSLLDKVGVELERLGDSTGRLVGL